MRPLITSNGLYLEAILDCVCTWGVGDTHHKEDCIPEASTEEGGVSGMVGPDGGGLNCCLGFKAFHRLTNRALGCQSIWLGGVPTAMTSNYICFQVTFIGYFIAHWDSIFAL